MRTVRIALVLALALIVALSLAACADRDDTQGEPPADNGAGGLRLANGLYDLEDGKVQAIGTLEYIELEGGFWAVTGAPGEDADSDTIAVIANGSDLESELEPLEGKQVSVVGTRLDGASIRMAGPEIEAETVEEMSDTGIAE